MSVVNAVVKTIEHFIIHEPGTRVHCVLHPFVPSGRVLIERLNCTIIEPLRVGIHRI